MLVTGFGVVAAGGFVSAQTQADSASVTFEDQQSNGQTVIVQNVTVPEGGFVVIHDEGLDDGNDVRSVIGVSRYLEPGTHEDVPVTVGQELPTAEVELTAMAHQDTNGNEVFDYVTTEGEVDGAYTAGDATMTPTETPAATATETPTEDGTETATPTEDGTATPTETENETATPTPEAGESGDPVSDSAMVDAVGDGAPDMNLQFSDQESNGTTVTVDRVTLYQGGYLVIHDTSNLDDEVDGVIGSSEYMAPGTYENVTVTLAEPVEFDDGEGANVTVRPHHDTNQNLVNDYVISLGDSDEPYMENDSAVTASATLTEEDVNDGTETPSATETPSETETPGETETPTETPNGTETETVTETETGDS